MIEKIKKLQIIRHCIQLIMFLLLPALYIMTFSGLKTVYQMIINGNFNFINNFPSLIEFVVITLFTILMGRWFCGWLCAFGTYNDWIYTLSRKLFKVNFRVNEKLDYVLKYVKYLVLIFIIIISWTIESDILKSASPWDAFAQIINISNVLSTLIIGFIILTLITIGAFLIERFFCRYLCPLGAVFAIISKFGIMKINKPKADCGKCRACTINCSMGLKLYKIDEACGGDCINCLKCTEICPRNNANTNILGKDLDTKLTSSIAMATFVGVYGITNVGGLSLNKSKLPSNTSTISSNETSDNLVESESENKTSQKYKEGMYLGRGEGFAGGETSVFVTITNGEISKIETLSHEDTPKYYDKVVGTITSSIISKQSTSVDTISGATYSSKGIMNAVEDALNKANNLSYNSNSYNKNNNMKRETIISDSTKSNQDDYKAGIYKGSSEGFRAGITKVSVTVKDGKITKIETVSHGDTPQYYDRVLGTITSSIISKQSTSVDTISGATYSSKGIIKAVENALIQAK